MDMLRIIDKDKVKKTTYCEHILVEGTVHRDGSGLM
jgi:hypothetical protein